MKITKILKETQIVVILLLICTHISHAQLTVSATATDEQCPGTGTLSISVQNANPSYPVNYKVYLLPETNIPFWNSSNSYLQGLQDGDYLIVASQNINGNITTAQTEATIGSNYVPLAFSISSVNAVCGNDGSMVINVTSGNPVTYEIIGGPATAPAQTSNVFNGLPAGTYEVRVTDNCGNGFVSTQTFYVEQPVLVLAGPNFSGSLVSCNSTTVNYIVSAENSELGIVYPLTAKFVVNPPSGTPQVYTQNITTGPANNLEISQTIPYYAQSYGINLEVTDPCGTVYSNTGGVINQPMAAAGSVVPVLCGEPTLVITPSNHLPPYTISFTSVPAGFNPADYNTTYPGAFTSSSATFGSEQNPVPLGAYEYVVTDACGRSATTQFVVEQPLLPEPSVAAFNHDCVDQLGFADVSIPNHPLLTAEIVSAPASYGHAMPYNVTSGIENGILHVENMPLGDYVLNLTDICGNTYTNIVCNIPAFSLQEPQYILRPDCEAGKGTVRITDDITSVIITAAPSTFTNPLPYNASFNINNNIFTMDGLPEGSYTFKVSTLCVQDVSTTVDVPGLVVEESHIELAGNCVTFDIDLNYVSNAEDLVKFWLQQYNDEINKWVHPETGVVYDESTNLSVNNAYLLTNNTINEQLPYIGEFRVIKSQKAYNNGSEAEDVKYCNEEYFTFFFYNELDIRGIYNLTCVGTEIDVLVDAIGVSPLRFEIISKNGDDSFYVDNGDSNIFNNLESGLYHVRVTDPCGGFRVQQFNISELPPLVSTTQPGDMGACDNEGTGISTFDLTTQDDIITNNLDDEIAAVTYHTSQADAENDVNAIANPQSYASGSATIYARVEWVLNPICYGIASFNLLVTPPTELVMDSKWAMCNGESVTVVADPGYVSYEWSTGATTESIEVSEEGTYTITVVSATGCVISKEIQVVPLMTPSIEHIDINDFNGDNNTVTIVTNALEHPEFYEYSIDGINYQASNVFTGIPAGEYTAIVRDNSNCGEGDSKDFHMLTYPNYFTPNGDGVNDKWRIPYAHLEPNMVVYIYDRYGKPVTSFGPTSEGWDGTMEGRNLPSTDYWFVVKRQDGREFRGHFAMMR